MACSRKRIWMVSALIAGLALGGCDDPVDDHEEEEHAEPEGVELVMNGEVVASYDGHDGTWTGELEVNAGTETSAITVRFVDEDGDEVELDEDLHLEVEMGDENIAQWVQDTPGEFEGRLSGEAAGGTTAVFRLMHGDHADFETEELGVDVNSA